MLVSQKLPRFSVLIGLDSLIVYVFLAITVWIAHFWHSASFGLYADDYTHISWQMMSDAEFWSFFQNRVLSFDQGRPIGFAIHAIFPFLAAKLGGLKAIYLIAYVINTVNTILFYKLLQRLFPLPIFALTGALAFGLFPADTTHAFLTHIHVYPSLTFLIIAFHCYLSGKKKWSYLVLLGSLLSYETIFPVFLAAPFLNKKWDSKLIRELVRHTLILGSMIICIVIIRKFGGESRVSNLALLPTLRMSFSHMVKGPITSMTMFVARPLETIRTLKGELLVFVSLYFAGLVWVLSRIKLNLSDNALQFATLIENQICHLKMPEFLRSLAKLASLGLIMLVLAYPLTLSVRATAIDGRESRVHIAAVIGAAILCACLCSAILSIANIYRIKNLGIACLAAYFALLVGFGLIVQQDYKLAWQFQRAFWTDLIQLCPDMTDENVIFVESTGLQNPRQMDAYNWATAFGLQQIYQLKPTYQYPDDTTLKPLVYLLRPGWKNKIASKDNLLILNKFTVSTISRIYGKVESSKVIFLETSNGKLIRRTSPLIINGKAFSLKQKSDSDLSPFEKGHLYEYLIRSPSEEPIKYIK